MEPKWPHRGTFWKNSPSTEEPFRLTFFCVLISLVDDYQKRLLKQVFERVCTAAKPMDLYARWCKLREGTANALKNTLGKKNFTFVKGRSSGVFWCDMKVGFKLSAPYVSSLCSGFP